MAGLWSEGGREPVLGPSASHEPRKLERRPLGQDGGQPSTLCGQTGGFSGHMGQLGEVTEPSVWPLNNISELHFPSL